MFGSEQPAVAAATSFELCKRLSIHSTVRHEESSTWFLDRNNKNEVPCQAIPSGDREILGAGVPALLELALAGCCEPAVPEADGLGSS